MIKNSLKCIFKNNYMYRNGSQPFSSRGPSFDYLYENITTKKVESGSVEY